MTEDEAFGGIHDWTRLSASERDMSTVLWIVSGSMSSSASVGGTGCAELDAIVLDVCEIVLFDQVSKIDFSLERVN